MGALANAMRQSEFLQNGRSNFNYYASTPTSGAAPGYSYTTGYWGGYDQSGAIGLDLTPYGMASAFGYSYGWPYWGGFYGGGCSGGYWPGNSSRGSSINIRGGGDNFRFNVHLGSGGLGGK
jgi:hypothetical protein